jgi:hypothetical protein
MVADVSDEVGTGHGRGSAADRWTEHNIDDGRERCCLMLRTATVEWRAAAIPEGRLTGGGMLRSYGWGKLRFEVELSGPWTVERHIFARELLRRNDHTIVFRKQHLPAILW